MPLAQKINGTLKRVPTWPIYLLGLITPALLFGAAATGQMGVEPIKALEHKLGELALQVFILTLAVTPLRRFTGVNLIKFRRAFGLLTFYLVSCHLLVWLVLDVQIPSQIWADIVKRPYITIGMLAFVILIPVALTSNNRSIKKLTPKGWKRLHQISYIAAVLGAIHFVMLTKGFQWEPLIYLGVIISLLSVRLLPKK